MASDAAMCSVFNGASAFNRNIGSWNTAAVANFYYSFYKAAAFNQNIGSWNVASVTSLGYMFSGDSSGSTKFNQNIGSWNVAAVTSLGTVPLCWSASILFISISISSVIRL